MAPLIHSLLFELRVARSLLSVIGSNLLRDLWRNSVLLWCVLARVRPSRLLMSVKRENSVGGRNAGGSER